MSTRAELCKFTKFVHPHDLRVRVNTIARKCAGIHAAKTPSKITLGFFFSARHWKGRSGWQLYLPLLREGYCATIDRFIWSRIIATIISKLAMTAAAAVVLALLKIRSPITAEWTS